MWALLLAAVLAGASGSVRAQQPAASDIAIYRPSDRNEQTVNTPRYVFAAEVSAFAPITSVSINGRQVQTPGTTYTTVQVGLRLKPGENRVVVEATTEYETARREFVIRLKYRDQPEAARKRLQVIAMVGAQHNSNPLQVPDDAEETPGVRTFVLVVPRYDFRLGSADDLRLGAIIARDTYDDEALAQQEVAFTQLTLTWLHGRPKDGQFQLGTGYNRVDLEADTLLAGKTHVESDVLLFTAWRRDFGQDGTWEAGLNLRQRDITAETDNPDFDSDALVYRAYGLVGGGLWGGLRGKARGGYEVTDAKGRYNDLSTLRGELSLTWPLGRFIPAVALRSRREMYAETDPVSGEKPVFLVHTGVLTLNVQVTDNWLVVAEAQAESQIAADPTQEYENRTYQLALAYIY